MTYTWVWCYQIAPVLPGHQFLSVSANQSYVALYDIISGLKGGISIDTE